MGHISVVLLDALPVAREGLRALLDREPDIEVIGEASRLDQAMALEAEPDVIVAELVLHEIRGSAIITSLRRRFERSAILVLTMVTEPTDVEAALAAGANGYSVKDSAAHHLVDAVRRVHRGEEYVEPSLGDVRARRADRPAAGLGGALTVREQEVLRLLALGHTNAEIAERLSVSLRTAEAHRANLLRKLGVHTRAELVRCALEAGLLRSPDRAGP
jgi:two-component system response regulator NreC